MTRKVPIELRCTHGHDRCDYPSEDCPYCEVKTDGILYRYYDVQYSAGVDEWGDPLKVPGRVGIRLWELDVIRRTKQGAWIVDVDGRHRFVNLTRHKRYACPTKREAMESFLARKARQRTIIKATLVRIAKAIEAARGVPTA